MRLRCNVTSKIEEMHFQTSSSGLVSKLVFALSVTFNGWVIGNMWGCFIVTTVVTHWSIPIILLSMTLLPDLSDTFLIKAPILAHFLKYEYT